MTVSVKGHAYRMSKKEYQEFLKNISENVPFGIYCIERNGKAELMNIHCKSMSELKHCKRKWKREGYKVYENR